MKKLLFLAVILCLFSMAAFAQKANYTGTWTLDISKSKLGDRAASIESMTWTVVQTDTELTVTTATKRAAPPADAPARPAGGGGGGMGAGRGMGGGDGKTVYSLDGKETKIEIDGQMGKIPVTLKAKSEGGKLNLSRSSTFTGPNGEITTTTKETWELGADGKTLTVNRESTSPRGTNTTTMVFTKS